MKTKRQIILAFIILSTALLFGTKAYPQQPDFLFEYQFEESWYFTANHALEITSSNGQNCYFVAICDFSSGDLFPNDPNYTNPARIFKLSNEGELVGELIIGEEGRRSVINRLYPYPEDTNSCLAIGRIHDNEHNYDKPFIAKFDHDLNLLWQKEIELPETCQMLCHLSRNLIDSHGDIVYCMGMYQLDSLSPYEPKSYLTYVRLSTEGEVLACAQDSIGRYLYSGAQGELFEFQDGSGDYGQTLAAENGISNDNILIRMNRDFELVGCQVLPWSIYQPDFYLTLGEMQDALVFSNQDSSLLSCCEVWYTLYNPHQTDYRAIALIKFDSHFDIQNLSFPSAYNDSVDRVAFNQGMTSIGDSVFFVCHADYEKWGGQVPNRIFVTKTDKDANIIWQRCYQADDQKLFKPYSITATSDGGCLVTGGWWIHDQYIASLFVLKFYSDGSLSVPELEEFVRPFTFYPNPAQDQLHLQYSPDVQPKTIELYDLQGRLVRTQSQGLESVNMQGLTPGQYLMKVTLEGGKSYTDKVVKE